MAAGAGAGAGAGLCAVCRVFPATDAKVACLLTHCLRTTCVTQIKDIIDGMAVIQAEVDLRVIYAGPMNKKGGKDGPSPRTLSPFNIENTSVHRKVCRRMRMNKKGGKDGPSTAARTPPWQY